MPWAVRLGDILHTLTAMTNGEQSRLLESMDQVYRTDEEGVYKLIIYR
jgi:hypothetical protein